jgi:hypothetical protein
MNLFQRIFKKKSNDAMWCISFHRKTIPYSNIEGLTIEIETLHLPDEFVREVAQLINKYVK